MSGMALIELDDETLEELEVDVADQQTLLSKVSLSLSLSFSFFRSLHTHTHIHTHHALSPPLSFSLCFLSRNP
jgi:uncharacterized coiled-coil protein SlyX